MKTSYPKNQIKVVLTEAIHPVAKEMLESEGFSVKLLAKAPEGKALLELAADTHMLGIRSKTEITPEVIAAAPKLLGVGCFCIGTNQVAVDDACAAGIPVFNSPFSNTRSVAELTIAEIIGLYRRLGDKSAGLHAGVWDKSADGCHEVRGRVLGLVGYGRIGSQVSVLAEAMGMRVLFFDILPRLAMGNARPARSLAELLEGSDVVSLHVPATPQTTNLIGAAQFKKMRKGAMLINNARGQVVDIAALVTAIRSGHLGGAALDVFPVEPVGKGETFESEIRGLPNVILTPHIGGSTEEAQENIAIDVCGKLIKFINNGSTTGAVNVPEVELPEQGMRDEEPGKKETLRSRRRHRILHFHRNVPGVMKKINGVAGDLQANIAAQYLQTNSQVGYVVLDVDPTDGEPLFKGLKAIPETIRVRMLW